MPGSYPFQARATYAYTSEHSDDLHFDEKQVITVTAEEDEDWYFGEYKTADGELKRGIFPKNFVENLAPRRPRAKDIKSGKTAEKAEEVASMLSTTSQPASSAEPVPAVTESAETEAEIASPRPINALPATIPEMKMSSRTEPPADTAPSAEEPSVDKGSGTFRDRIAAFNIPEKAPIVPHSKPKPPPAKKPSLSTHSYVPTVPPTSSTQQRPKPSTSTLPQTEPEESVQEDPQPLSSLKDRITKLQSTQLDSSGKKPKGVRRTQSIGSEADNPPGSPFAENPEGESPFGHEAVVEEPNDATTEYPNRKSGEELTRQVSGVSSISQGQSHRSGQEDEASGSSEEEMDPEVARRIALRERMAKMSGGMGMHLGFAMPGAVPQKPSAKKKPHEVQERLEEESVEARAVPHLPQINTSSQPKQSDVPGDRRSPTPTSAQSRSRSSPMASPPTVAPVPLPNRTPNSRAVPPLPPFSPPERSSTIGATSPRNERAPPRPGNLSEEEDAEETASDHGEPVESPKFNRSTTLPITSTMTSQSRQNRSHSPPTSPMLSKRTSYIGGGGAMPAVPGASATPSRKENVRAPPPVPNVPAPVPRNMEVERAPYQATSSISSTHSGGDHSSRGVGAEPSGPSSISSDGEVTGYEADDDTDLASGVNHRDALVNADEGTEDDVSVSSPHPSRSIPPPPPPTTRPPHARVPSGAASMAPETPTEERLNRVVPPPPTPTEPQEGRRGQRQSTEMARPPAPAGAAFGRTSADQYQSSMEHEYMAKDVDLSRDQTWWREPNMPPPVFRHRRNELIYEIDESSNTRRGGRTTVTRDIYVLFHDYSQTVVTVQYDQDELASAKFEQRHEAPPKQVRKDDLESAHKRFGRPLLDKAMKAQGSVVGDGEAFTLVTEIFKSVPEALPPIGYDALGSVIFVNLANSSVQQHDEIRPGDMISFRLAKFHGHKGGLHQKYSMDVGKPSHVGLVQEWDGTKKKIRVIEQGRESKKVSSVSYKMGDLKSGEVSVWRVMPRGYVGWE